MYYITSVDISCQKATKKSWSLKLCSNTGHCPWT